MGACTNSTRNSDKIKWVYLKPNPFNLKIIAFKDYEDPKEIMNFIQQYVDHDKIFERALNKKIRTWYEALSWKSGPSQDKRKTTCLYHHEGFDNSLIEYR